MGLTILLLVGFVTAAYFYLKHVMSYWKNRGVPSDDPSLLLGNMDGVGQKIHFTTNLQLIYDKFKVGNKLCGFYLLQSPRLIIIDLDLIKNILIKDFNYFADRGVYNNAEDDPLSAHLFALEGKNEQTFKNYMNLLPKDFIWRWKVEKLEK